jgi:hypothetical protein
VVRPFALLLLLCLTGAANDWIEFRYGPFEVLSSQGERDARETLNFLEQLRNALGAQIGQTDMQTAWPVRVILPGKRSQPFPEFRFGRDAWICSISEIGPATAASLTRVLLDSSPGHLPPHIKRGLITLYSTLQVDGTRVTLGVPPAQKDRDWTRAHLLAVHPDYSGKLRVLLANLGRGVEEEVAYRNAFSQTQEEIERAVDKYMEAGQYGTIPAASRAISAKQFLGKPLDASAGQIAAADVLLANGDTRARGAYEAILKARPESVEAREGLGLLTHSKEELQAAKSARPLLEYAKLLEQPAAKRDALMKAAAANPRWAEPHKLLAGLETHPAQKLAALRKAAQLDPQDTQTWLALAVEQENANQITEAAKSWAAAERVTDDPVERERIRQTRVAGEHKRAEAELAAREEARRKTEQEIADLRNKALMEIRKAEARANAGKPVIDPKTLDEYKEGPDTKKVSGVLHRVDCLGIPARLTIVSGKSVTRILVPDPAQVAIGGGGERSFGCGVQKPARSVTVEYIPRTDPKQSTAGDAVTIEFR